MLGSVSQDLLASIGTATNCTEQPLYGQFRAAQKEKGQKDLVMHAISLNADP